MINIVIPMAGLGSRFVVEGYADPKPFISTYGGRLIEIVCKNLYIPNSRLILIARHEHLEPYSFVFDKLQKKYSCIIVPVKKTTEGAAATVLKAVKYINNDEELLLGNSDQFIEFDINDFINDARSRNLDGSILTFKDITKNPKWSFAVINDQGHVIKVKEKEPISENATVGIYYFKKGQEFVNSGIEMIVDQDKVNGEYYTCPTYNSLIERYKKIGVYEISSSSMHGLGTPQDLKKYESTFNK